MSDKQTRTTSKQSSKNTKTAQTTCRMCGQSFDAKAETFPFCSKRCRMADLGEWFSGNYSVSRAITEEDEL